MPWADVMYAMDRDYWRSRSSNPKRWKTIAAEAADLFEGELVSPFPYPGVTREKFRICHNSGVGAIALAVHYGAQRVVLLGFDCQFEGGRKDGRKHHHPDHPGPLGNCGSIRTWPGQFRKLARELEGRVEIVNASRATALTCWPRQPLEEALAHVPPPDVLADDHRHRAAPLGDDDRGRDHRARYGAPLPA